MLDDNDRGDNDNRGGDIERQTTVDLFRDTLCSKQTTIDPFRDTLCPRQTTIDLFGDTLCLR